MMKSKSNLNEESASETPSPAPSTENKSAEDSGRKQENENVKEYNGYRKALFVFMAVVFVFISFWLGLYYCHTPYTPDETNAALKIAKHGNNAGEVYWVGTKDSSNYLYWSVDTATAWHKSQIKVDSVNQPFVINDAWVNIKKGTGIMACNDNVLLYSNDNFKTWKPIESPDKRWEADVRQTDDVFNDLFFVHINDSTGEGIAGGEQFSFIRTKDFGATWTFDAKDVWDANFTIKEGYSEDSAGVLGIIAHNTSENFDTLLFSTDNGRTWEANQEDKSATLSFSETEKKSQAKLKLRYKASPQNKNGVSPPLNMQQENSTVDQERKKKEALMKSEIANKKSNPIRKVNPTKSTSKKKIEPYLFPDDTTKYVTRNNILYSNLFYNAYTKLAFVITNEGTNKQELLFTENPFSKWYSIDANGKTRLQNDTIKITGIFGNNFQYACLITQGGNIYKLGGSPGSFKYLTQLKGIYNNAKILGFKNNNYVIALGNDSLNEALIYSQPTLNAQWEIRPILLSSNNKLPISERTFFMVILFSTVFIYFFNSILKEKKKEIKEAEAKDEAYARLIQNTPTIEDALNFKTNKDAIVKLITNKFTSPPVNIVVSGEWGSGKSSLMQQVKDHFEKDEKLNSKTIALWFNVWHMQSEQHLIGTFVNALLRQLDYTEGFMFRVRLFCHRLQTLNFSTRFTVIFLLTNLLLILSYLFFKFPPVAAIAFFADFRKYIAPVLDGVPVLFSPIINIDADKPLPWVITLISTLAGGYLLSKEFVPSGISKFFNLMPKDKFRIETSMVDTGFREKYKKEVWEIFRASKKSGYRFLVFIDDIDRIEGEKIIELLETINFITDTASKPFYVDADFRPPIYFIMGMYLEEIVKNVDAQLKENIKASNSSSSTAQPYELGARYMEKMIDLIVKVTPLSEIDREKINVDKLINLKTK